MGVSWADQKKQKKNKKNSTSFWSILFSYSMQQQWTISRLDWDMQWKVDFIQQPVMTTSVVGPRKSSKALPKAKLAPPKFHGHCLVVCCPSDPLQLSESRWNHYIWESLETARSAAIIGQQKGPKSSPGQCKSYNQHFKSWMHWGAKFCLICHFLLTSCQQTTTSSSILTISYRKHASTTSSKQKMLSKCSLNPEAQIFTL